MLPGYLLSVLTLLSAAYVPAVLALIWIRWGERGRKERWDDLFLTFLGGAVIAVIAATVLEIAAAGILSSAVIREYDFFVRNPNFITFIIIIAIAPIIEEFVKAMVVLRFSRYIWRPRNGLVFGAACGLGFAATENFLYEGTALFTGGFAAFITLAIIRSVSSLLMHASATSISGYGVARAKSYADHWWPFLIFAILMHSTFNMFASFGELFETRIGPIANVIGLGFSIGLVLIATIYLRWRIGGYHA
ncbi:MAG: PrsW family glutamic-type intramembrane protease [Methanomassiliicoccus sp.]|nr:PrsW family glutamic-type intramembrane protease [Methanomassiliicoccus sp.]